MTKLTSKRAGKVHKVLHHFRRNRTYAKHERLGVVGGLLILTLAVSAGGWLLLGKPAASATTLAVSNVELSNTSLVVGTTTSDKAVITLTNKQTGEPAKDIWVGLNIVDPSLRTLESTYHGWYSPMPERAFFSTNEKGQVSFPLSSKIAGAIEYRIYAANPEMENEAKYQDLGQSFTITYTETLN